MKNEELAQNAEKGSTKASGCLGIRHLQVFLLFWGMAFGYCLRVSMSEAIVAMSKSDQPSDRQYQVYNWSSLEQSLIQGAFFCGYTIMQIPSGYIAGVWSAQKLLCIGILLCGIFNILIPTAAYYGGYIAVCVCRVGMGLSQSCLLPCTHTLLSKWATPTERARFGTMAYAGGQFGTVICFPISGWLAISKIGWPSIFYVFGALSTIWSILFFFLGSDNPSKHTRISERERRLIENSLIAEQKGKMDSNEKLKTPWKAIFTSAPMWALIIAHCGQNWGYWTLITEIPTYMNDVLKFELEKNGNISALPYLVMWILSFPMSWLADYSVQKGISKGIVRKTCNTIAHWGPAIALICLASLAVHDTTIAVGILVVAVGLNAGALCGFQINHIDLSPNFAGTMMSITNCIASIIAIIVPVISGLITNEKGNVQQWNTVFYLSAAVYFIGNLIFIIFGKTDIQPFNNPTTANVEKQNANEIPMA